jgi:hypothetical protein
MVLHLKGILDFELPDVTKKHVNQSSWKKTAIIKTNDDLDQYYYWFLKKRFNIDLNRNLRGSHVTIINDRIDFKDFQMGSKIFNRKECDFYLDIEPRFNGKHWWLRVYSPMAESIRQACGLNPQPYFSFHLTIGHIKEGEHHTEQAEYLLRQIQKFEIISNEPRKPLEEHKIIEVY